MKTVTLCFALLAILVLPGCLKRREIVTVAADGRIGVRHEIRGDEADLTKGPDAMPAGRPWTVTLRKYRKDDGNEEHELVATASFARAAELPTTFAPPELGAGALRFATELRQVRVEGDRVLWLLRRTYRARSWADYDHLFRSLVPAELAEKLEKPGDVGKLEGREQERAIQVLVDYEIAKMAYWTGRALGGLGLRDEAATLGATERIRAALGSWRRENLGPERVSGFMSLGDQALAAVGEEMVAETRALVLREAEAALGEDPGWDRERFLALRADAERDHDVSQDLQDEDFELVLRLPGEIVVAGGGTRTADGLVFSFKGRDLLDRDQVIEVVYAVPRE